jgi:two-component system, cell cycle sensor histidine kinase and response regulator CckA
MNKKEYIESNILKLIHQWINIATGAGAIVICALSLLDYLVTPVNFKTFLLYRIVAAIGIFLVYLFNKRKIYKNRQNVATIVGAVIVATMVALMIENFGGHQSPYFAGIILTIFFVVGLTSLDVKMSIITSFIMYAIYLIPILSYDKISNRPFFISANFFILSTIFATVALRYLIQKRFISEFGLQYDLDQQKEQLAKYSTHLEELVQKRTKDLSMSEQRFRALFDNANDGVVVLDKDGIIINMNNKFCELHGFDKEALIGTHFKFLEVEDHKEEKEERLKRILDGESLVFETEHYKRDGSKILLEVSSKGINIGGDLFVQSFHRDITEKKAIQEQLMHSQKMESIGQLAGGIAHNFNNLLTAILGYAELLKEYSDLDNDSKQKVNSIESSARKAGILVSKLLSFSRKETSEVLPLNLNDVINDSVKLFEGVLDKKIGLKTNLSDNILTVEGDPNQLEQVIMNLMVNARDAMPDGGLITIKTSLAEIERDRFNMPSYIIPGKYVLLTISDTGCGIPKEITNRIFEPFFTTKEKGKGTGLGLAMVYGVIKDHKGYITVQSEVGKGSTFDVYLPVSGKTAYKALKQKLFSVSGHENILLVDDEEEVLNFIKDILETHGYKVLPASNPLAAIDIFKKLGSEIHLVISDIVMPLMDGKELIKNLRAIKPDIRIIVVSGFCDEAVNKDILKIDDFLKKPFEINQLLSKVRRVLDAGIRNLPPY